MSRFAFTKIVCLSLSIPLAPFSLIPYYKHFLMKCHNYQAQRAELVRAVSRYTSVTLQTLIFGNGSLPININIKIFEAVQTYIVNTKRR